MLDEGTTLKWKSSEYFDSKLLPADDHAAYMGELVLARNTGTLHAEGGPCPIIAVYRPDVHLGALLHVNGGDAEVDGDNHEELINGLLNLESEIVDGGICHVFLDEAPAPGFMEDDDEADQIHARTAYATRIQEFLESQGFLSVTVVLDGVGKAVKLDILNSKVVSKDENDVVAFEQDYHEL